MASAPKRWILPLLLVARMSAQPGGGGDGPGGDGNDKRCRFNMTQRAFHSHRTLEDILLSTDYDATSRPEVAREKDLKNKPTAVSWTMNTKGFSISEKANTVTLTGEVTESWVDERLAFNYTQGDTCPSDSPPVWTVSKSNYYQIWRPWLYISNQVSTSDISNAGSSLKINSDGQVTWTYNTLITARCPLDLKRSPFDTQTCGVDVMSLSYDAFEMEISGAAYSTQPTLEWEMLGDAKVSSNSAVKEGPDAQQTGPSYAVLEVRFDFKRRNGYQIREIFVPAILYLILAFCGFWIDRNVAPARVAISVIPVLITRTLLSSVYATTSLLPYVTIMTRYLNILSYMNIGAVCQYAAVQWCLQNEKKALLRLKGLKAMRDVIDKLVDATEADAPPRTETQDPEAPMAVPGKRISRARSERFDALLAQKGVNPVAGRAVAELKRIFERADRDGSGDIDIPEFCKELRDFGIYDPPDAARLALSSMRYAANQDDAAPTVDFDEFVDLLLGYEKHRVADIFPGDNLRDFRYLPASLQLDVACRVGFLPFAGAFLAVGLSILDAQTK